LETVKIEKSLKYSDFILNGYGCLWLFPSHHFPTQNVKLNHYIAVFERVVLLCKICEQQTSNRIESLAIESGCIRE
jgi:hypothetical protein